jgi:hypothetical protein
MQTANSEGDDFELIGRPIAIASQNVDGLNTFLQNNRELTVKQIEISSDEESAGSPTRSEASPTMRQGKSKKKL